MNLVFFKATCSLRVIKYSNFSLLLLISSTKVFNAELEAIIKIWCLSDLFVKCDPCVLLWCGQSRPFVILLVFFRLFWRVLLQFVLQEEITESITYLYDLGPIIDNPRNDRFFHHHIDSLLKKPCKCRLQLVKLFLVVLLLLAFFCHFFDNFRFLLVLIKEMVR